MKTRALALVAFLALTSVAFVACVSKGDGSDFDFDGVPDRLEDTNDNFLTDPGETNFNDPDTDRDGVCDGRSDREDLGCTGCEDCNNNGFFEPCLNETDPLNDDTDNDGIPDGQDPEPLSNFDFAGRGIDCAAGNVRLPYGASLPPGKPFPATPTPTPFPTLPPIEFTITFPTATPTPSP
jgi:hypothetical protein